ACDKSNNWKDARKRYHERNCTNDGYNLPENHAADVQHTESVPILPSLCKCSRLGVNSSNHARNACKRWKIRPKRIAAAKRSKLAGCDGGECRGCQKSSG